jgi:DNA polymerase/3'-5' exonuclease PolX
VSSGTQTPLAVARLVATDLRAHLGWACDRLEVAGSIRRGKPMVGDIELVAIGRVTTEEDGLWGGLRRVEHLPVAIDALIAQGVLAPHPTDPKRGPRYSKLVLAATGMQLDLFSPPAASFGLILLIRTGPADYSQRLVTIMKRGRHPHHVAGGELHEGTACWGGTSCIVVPTLDELDVYAALGLPFVPPEDRR